MPQALDLGGQDRAGDAARGHEGRLGAYRSGGRLNLAESDVVAECFELSLQAACAVLDAVAAAVPVGAEFAEGDLVADDVVVGDEDVVAGRADRFRLTAASAQLRVMRGEVGALGA